MSTQSDEEILAVAREGFLEEAREMLQQFEDSLLTLEKNPQDHEAMNSAFRAAHTIKGTSGLFGFEAIGQFTHEMESVLDCMRSGTLALNERGFALLLKSRDQLDGLLNELGTTQPDPELAACGMALAAQLRALREGGSDDQEDDGLWLISLRMGSDALRNGLDPMSFIRYLDNVGEVRQLWTQYDAVPELAMLDPESCYLNFEIQLKSEADQNTIEKVFEFLEDDAQLSVVKKAASGGTKAIQNSAAETVNTITSTSAESGAINSASANNADPNNKATASNSVKEKRTEETRFVRVRADKLDKLIDLIGELVIASSGAQLAAQLHNQYSTAQEQSARFSEAALRIHDLVEQARDGALGLRMAPIGETFSRFQRVVRDVSKQIGKEVELEISGGDTELDKSMVETIADPLMHLVRNSLDHGLETPQDRLAAGKPARGRLGLHAYHESGSVFIEVSDDGRGLNRERILAKAVERGLASPDAVLDDEAVYQLIFLPGFSTAEAVTSLSGRGVGMDVVKRNVEALRGTIKIASQPGQGATIQIRLPLTLAIIDGFLTSVGGVSYVLPLELVAECLAVPTECSQDSDKVAGYFDLRGEVLPYLDLGRFYRHALPKNGRRSLVLVRDGASRVGLVVDRLHGEHQTVIKPLGAVFQHIQGLAGSTILGSGEVALILDVPALLTFATGALKTQPTSSSSFQLFS